MVINRIASSIINCNVTHLLARYLCCHLVLHKYNREAVIQSVRNLVLLNKFEVPFHPEIHSGVAGLLFENANILTAHTIRDNIYNCLTNYEPRIKLIDVRVFDNIDNNSYDVDIEFEVINIPEVITLTLALQRVR